MNIDNYQLIAVLFDGSSTAQAALKDINELKKEGAVKYKDAVAAYKKKGKVKLKQTKERKGVLGGGVVGFVIGAVLGGPLVLAAMGALLGGALNRGFNNKLLKQICDDMEDDESVLFVALEQADWGKLEGRLPGYKGVVYREVIPLEFVVAYEDSSSKFETAKALDSELSDND